jgi:hypothetical protein
MPRFIYYNINPMGKKENDCVTRAISFATQTPYEEVRKKLYHSAKLLNCEKLCSSCYSFAIEKVFGARAVNCDYMTVYDFAEKHPKGTYLVRMTGHLSVIKDGNLYDIFNCFNEYLSNAWEIR